ncbi:hypothetical protein N665_1342s0010 [Sinapis alba]|nr:hypothetical protein N665_1342s0010 [Sinapis alba]
MVSVTRKDDQIVEFNEITSTSSPKNTYDSNNDELNDTDEEEVNVCDTCGVVGFIDKLAICDNCGVGAEHTYCMAVKLEDVPERWYCSDCVENTGSIKKKSKSSIDLFEMGESAFQKQNDLSTQKSSETVGMDLNLNVNPKLDHSLDPSIDLNVNPNPPLDPNLDLNVELSLDCGSSYRSSSTSNFQAHTRMRASPNPLLGQEFFEEEDQCAKRRRVDSLYEMDLKRIIY